MYTIKNRVKKTKYTHGRQRQQPQLSKQYARPPPFRQSIHREALYRTPHGVASRILYIYTQ